VKKVAPIYFCLFMLAAPPLAWPESLLGRGQADEYTPLIGLRLNELVARFGAPQKVFASRGDELWQDDVVFAYNEADFYIHQDRVWQIGLKAAYGMKLGDLKAVAMLVLGASAEDKGAYALYAIRGGSWPLEIRVNFDNGLISAIFIYRQDY
jgi:hypothetical protein